MTLNEQLALLNESLWYIRWSLAFIIASVATEIAALIELVRDSPDRAFGLMLLAGASLLFSKHLHTKSEEYYERL